MMALDAAVNRNRHGNVVRSFCKRSLSNDYFHVSAAPVGLPVAGNGLPGTMLTPPRPSVRPLAYAGLSFGGDTLATAKFDNDNKTDIKAGQLAQIGAGLIGSHWQPAGCHAPANYQIDGTTARRQSSVHKDPIRTDRLFHRH